MQSIEKLLERDNPGLETVKMQVEYDESFLAEERSSQKAIKTRNKMVSTHKKLITEFQLEDSSDFQSLTTLYKMIFRFLLEFPPNGHPNDKVVEREVAAALESVFPRIGLKTFVQLSLEEKGTLCVYVCLCDVHLILTDLSFLYLCLYSPWKASNCLNLDA